MLTFGVGALGTPLVGLIWQLTDSRAPVFDVFAVSALLMAALALCFRLLWLRAAQQAHGLQPVGLANFKIPLAAAEPAADGNGTPLPPGGR
jgi:hypothetical protein